ncbi:MAG: hypothetical protein IH934_04700 [Nanoarchaeota archaeon]|nr:hypothetical protein [Nanoarchaeota archaeon]
MNKTIFLLFISILASGCAKINSSGWEDDGSLIKSLSNRDVLIQQKLDIGVPGVASGLDVGEGGSYTKDKDGTVIIQAFNYDASAASGSRFTELTLDATNTILEDADDRFYLCSQKIFWAGRFEVSTAKEDEHLDFLYYDGNGLIDKHFMGILKNNATALGEQILQQTVEKEYFTWDHGIGDNWTTADDVLDVIPDLTADSYCVVLQAPSTVLATAPVVTEIKARGTDFDLVTGTSYPVFWGNSRVENHERIQLSVAKSPGGTGTTTIAIDSAHSQTVFNFNGAGDNIAFIWTLPEALDTSNEIHLSLDWSANAVDTFNIDLTMSEIRNNTPIGSGISPDFTESTVLVADDADTIYTGVSIAEAISIHNMTSSDSLSFELERTDATNAMYPLSLIIHYVVFSTGEIITAD